MQSTSTPLLLRCSVNTFLNLALRNFQNRFHFVAPVFSELDTTCGALHAAKSTSMSLVRYLPLAQYKFRPRIEHLFRPGGRVSTAAVSHLLEHVLCQTQELFPSRLLLAIGHVWQAPQIREPLAQLVYPSQS